MLLMRCSSGEMWNTLMWDYHYNGMEDKTQFVNSGNFPGAKYYCFDQEPIQIYKMGEFTGCGTYFSIPFFLLIVIIMSMMILNMFIAVVLEGFSESMKDSLRCVNTESYEFFRLK